MPAGFRLPPDAAKALVPDASTTLEDGLENLRRAIRRLKTENERTDSPFLGRLTGAEWMQLHFRHAELHFSFLVPE